MAAEDHPFDAAAYEELLNSFIAEVVKKQARSASTSLTMASSRSRAGPPTSRAASRRRGPPRTDKARYRGDLRRDLPDFPEWFNGARAGGGPSAQSYVPRASAAAWGRQTMIQGAFCTGPLKSVVSRKLCDILLTSRRQERPLALRSSA